MIYNIGRFMQELRKGKNLTQKELADRIGVSDKTISKWENGNSIPDTTILLPLCKELDITVNEFLAGQRIPPENYSMKAEENMMALIQENEKVKKGNLVLQIIGGIAIVIALIFMGLSIGGISFLIFMDWPSLVILCLMEVGIVLVSGARTKDKVLRILSKTLLPSGLLISIVSAIVILGCVTIDIEVIGANLAVAFLSVVYALVAKIVVEILEVRK